MSSITAPALKAAIQMRGECLSILRMSAQTDSLIKRGILLFHSLLPPLSFCGLLDDQIGPEISSSSSKLLLGEVTCSGGTAGGYPCKDVDLLAHLPLSTFGSFEGNDIWGWTSSTGREFALMGLTDGTGMVEVTNPASPVYLGKLPTFTVSSSWRDIKIYNDHAFIVAEASSHGMQVFDLNQLLTAPVDSVFTETAHYDLIGNAHNIVINEASGFAYIVGTSVKGRFGCNGGLHMVNIENPISPAFAGCYGGDGYVHDAHCIIYDGPDTAYFGREICFCANEDTITIVDVTNKASPVQVSRTGYASSGYTHQGWLSEDHKYFIFGDETDELSQGISTKTLVMDVQALGSPSLAGDYFGPTLSIDHNLYVKNGLVYLSSYTAGLRVLKIDDLSTASFTEIGFFDIYPASDSATFNGAWSVYPFFESGTVIVSGIEQGLFVLRPVLTNVPTNAPTIPVPTNAPVNAATNAPVSAATNAPTISPVLCGGNQASCSVPADCCSNNCKNGSCKGKRRLGAVFGEAT
jgi:choice-of-anchor B domain-containing protein